MTDYEFTPEQDKVVDQLRRTLLQITAILLALGILLMLIGHGLPGISQWVFLVSSVFVLILGVVYYLPLDNLKRVTSTKGDDINQMLIAMSDLAKAFSTAQIIIILLIGMSITGIGILLS